MEFGAGVHGVGSAEDGARGHDGEGEDGEVDGVGGDEEHDVAFPDAVAEAKEAGEGGDGGTGVGVGYCAAGLGVDEGGLEVVVDDMVGEEEGGERERVVVGREGRGVLPFGVINARSLAVPAFLQH